MIAGKSDSIAVNTPKSTAKEIRYPLTPIQALNLF